VYSFRKTIRMQKWVDNSESLDVLASEQIKQVDYTARVFVVYDRRVNNLSKLVNKQQLVAMRAQAV